MSIKKNLTDPMKKRLFVFGVSNRLILWLTIALIAERQQGSSPIISRLLIFPGRRASGGGFGARYGRAMFRLLAVRSGCLWSSGMFPSC